MEPFALFQLIQSLLSPEKSNEGANTATPPQTPSAENEPPTTFTEQEPATNPASQEAVLQFLSAHESRAKRIKKQ